MIDEFNTFAEPSTRVLYYACIEDVKRAKPKVYKKGWFFKAKTIHDVIAERFMRNKSMRFRAAYNTVIILRNAGYKIETVEMGLRFGSGSLEEMLLLCYLENRGAAFIDPAMESLVVVRGNARVGLKTIVYAVIDEYGDKLTDHMFLLD